MDVFVLTIQIVLLVLMIALWIAAKRDVQSVATTQQTPTLDKIEELKAAVGDLLDELDQKIDLADQRINELSLASQQLQGKLPSRRTVRAIQEKHDPPEEESPVPVQVPISDKALNEGKYDEVYLLSETGVNAEDIARRTGLGSAEVEMVISLRPLPGGD